MNIRSESLEKNRTLGNGHHLPEIGASFINPVGIECLVANHMHVPTAYSCQRYRDGKGNQPEDLFPVIRIRNLSKKLLDFINVIDLCSPKQLLILDTMPQVKSIMPPGGHFVDTLSVPDSILLFIDAFNVQEIHLAHEIGHLWVQYVDLAEDERVLRDVSDPARLNQFSFIQSFVIDRRVNDVIEEKGFDVSLIAEDQWEAVASLGRAMAAGYRPETKREGVFMAIALANQMLEEDKRSLHSLAISSDTMSLVYQHCPELFGLANGLADVVREFGYSDKWCIQNSIDRCLELAFTFTGDPIDFVTEVYIPEQQFLDEDRHRDWITGAPLALKREVGRFMATQDVPLNASYVLHQLPRARCAITFEIQSGETIGPYQLETTWQFEDAFSIKLRIEEINRQNRERIMKQQELGRKGIPNLPGQPRRLYMAGLGRFTTRVREREWLGGENPYGYANGNPIKWIDPSGNSFGIVDNDDDDERRLQSAIRAMRKDFANLKLSSEFRKCLEENHQCTNPTYFGRDPFERISGIMAGSYQPEVVVEMVDSKNDPRCTDASGKPRCAYTELSKVKIEIGGKVYPKKSTIRFCKPLCLDSSKCGYPKCILLHELLHAIGYTHEGNPEQNDLFLCVSRMYQCEKFGITKYER